MCYSLWYNAPTSCNTESSAPEDGQNNCPKHVELTGFINKSLFLHLVGCPYCLYKWCTVKKISDNEIYLLIIYIKNVLWREAKRLSYIRARRTAPKCLALFSSFESVGRKTANQNTNSTPTEDTPRVTTRFKYIRLCPVYQQKACTRVSRPLNWRDKHNYLNRGCLHSIV